MTAKRRGSALWFLAACGVVLSCAALLREAPSAHALEHSQRAQPEVASVTLEEPPDESLATPEILPVLVRAAVPSVTSGGPNSCSLVVRAQLPAGTPVDTLHVVLRQGAQVLDRVALDSAHEVRFEELPRGRFSVTLGGEPWPRELVAMLSPTGPSRTAIIDLRRGEERDVCLEVHRAVALRGTVFDADGCPVEGACLRLQSTCFVFGTVTPLATSDQAGAFEFTGLAPGEYRMHASWTDTSRTDAPPPPVELSLRPGEDGWQDLLAETDGCTLVGRLVGRDGEPLAGVVVDCELADSASEDLSSDGEVVARELRGRTITPWSLRLARVQTDANGEYRVERLPRVAVVLRVASTGARLDGLSRARPRYHERLGDALDLRLADSLIELGSWTLEPRAME